MVADASAQHARIIERHLRPAEQVLWTGQPVPWCFARSMRWNVAAGLPVTAVLAYLAWQAPNIEIPDWLPFLAPLAPFALLMGPCLLLAPLIGLLMARMTIYVLTDRRAMIFAGSRVARSFPPSQLQNITCTTNRDGSGDVIFDWKRRWRKHRTNLRYFNVAFLGIPNARDVEQLVRQLAQTAAEFKTPAPPRSDWPGDLRAPPKGFTIVERNPDVCTILHTRRGMVRMNAFLGAWLTGWTAAYVLLLREFLSRGHMERRDIVPFIAFWAAEVFVACFLAYSLFCRTTIRIEHDAMTIETVVLVVRWSRTIPRQAIRRLVQIKDGGEGKDRFPSWGLRLEGPRTRKILRRLPYDHSYWLGRVLADWAGVEFEECPLPDR